jgi:hypothetical protein
MLPPITPITPDTYKAHNLPWYTVSDFNVASLAPKTGLLRKVKTITHIDLEKVSAKVALIDPDHPPSCSIHMKVLAEVVFRPCGHTACSGCLGKAMLKHSRCPLCSEQIGRFVGMKEPVAGVDEAGNTEEEGNSESVWNIMFADIDHSEALAAQAINQGKVVVIHLEKDKVAPLHSNNASQPITQPAPAAHTSPPGLAGIHASSEVFNERYIQTHVGLTLHAHM